MPTIELNTPGYDAPVDTYATATDARNALGTLRDRLPSWVEVEAFVVMAHATVVDRLARPYPNGIPTFDGVGLHAVRYAEAKIAAAEILEAIRVNLPDLGDAPERMRAAAYETLDDGVVGFPPGSSDDPGTPTPGASTSTPGPRVSSFTQLSAFPDPYGEARSDARFE